MIEPFRIIEHILPNARGRLFTCARPGRSLGTKRSKIDDDIVKNWVSGLPLGRPLHLIMLLGSKPAPKNISEYSYYSFRGVHETKLLTKKSIDFQEWLGSVANEPHVVVHSFPTIDLQPISPIVAAEVVSVTLGLLKKTVNVVMVDSGGVTRTGSIVDSLK